jgi:hypothetical protein
MKKWVLGIALAALVSVSASAGIFDLFKTLLQTTETIKTGETIKNETAVGFYDEVEWDDAEYK